MRKHPTFRKAALAVTRWIGSPASLVVHTIFFILSFLAVWANLLSFNSMLLILTTVVSLEAIYLSIFIQMTINFTSDSLEEVEQDIDEIQEDVGEIQEDVEELQEDVEEMSEEDMAGERAEAVQQKTLSDIQTNLRKLMSDIERLQHARHSSGNGSSAN
jgi:low affinity Fe/Cu permease